MTVGTLGMTAGTAAPRAPRVIPRSAATRDPGLDKPAPARVVPLPIYFPKNRCVSSFALFRLRSFSAPRPAARSTRRSRPPRRRRRPRMLPPKRLLRSPKRRRFPRTRRRRPQRLWCPRPLRRSRRPASTTRRPLRSRSFRPKTPTGACSTRRPHSRPSFLSRTRCSRADSSFRRESIRPARPYRCAGTAIRFRPSPPKACGRSSAGRSLPPAARGRPSRRGAHIASSSPSRSTRRK